MRGYDFKAIEDLRYSRNRSIQLKQSLPDSLPVVHIVGFPESDDLSTAVARRSCERLLPFGVNDGGGVLLSDVLDYPGVIYPVLGQDHYLRDLNLQKVLAASLKAILCSETFENTTACP